MSAQQAPEELRIERLLAMAARLIEALEKDIASLKSGNARDLRTVDPEIQKLSVLYGREAAALNPKAAIKRRSNCANACSRRRRNSAIFCPPKPVFSRACVAPAKA